MRLRRIRHRRTLGWLSYLMGGDLTGEGDDASCVCLCLCVCACVEAQPEERGDHPIDATSRASRGVRLCVWGPRHGSDGDASCEPLCLLPGCFDVVRALTAVVFHRRHSQAEVSRSRAAIVVRHSRYVSYRSRMMCAHRCARCRGARAAAWSAVRVRRAALSCGARPHPIMLVHAPRPVRPGVLPIFSMPCAHGESESDLNLNAAHGRDRDRTFNIHASIE